ncbi:unnamed protein product [Eruca vesicaria subsp. sativa]|uniref:Uncharacterized protein n=1 Tax=Eruca vesicaria subsp. sativa TaxID=29727 RepID=A0ABC8KHA6_ERUVS|nr:unnamed protein product [Eruca vesicaria subsp. sativa]
MHILDASFKPSSVVRSARPTLILTLRKNYVGLTTLILFAWPCIAGLSRTANPMERYPRFFGGGGIVFNFHGKSNEHFSLVSDPDVQINARFTGHRPIGRTRDFTWIQALGILFNTHKFALETTKVATWDSEVDHLKFTIDGQDLVIPGKNLFSWYSSDKEIKIERLTEKNSVVVTIKDKAEIMVNVVPFKFINLSPKVDGILGRTYRPDFKNPAKPGVAMPVVGGEDSFRTSSLLSHDCKTCLFSEEVGVDSGSVKVKTEKQIRIGKLQPRGVFGLWKRLPQVVTIQT